MTTYILQDFRVNRGYPKSQFVLIMFRLAQAGRRTPLRLPLAIVYRLVVEWVMGIELPVSTSVGPRLRIFHGVGLVVNPSVKIGADVSVRHNVTLGNRKHSFDCPVIGDGVDIGVGAIVLGDIAVGVGAQIGAGALVLDDIPAGGKAFGVKAR